MRLEHEVEVARPPEEVYAYLARVENLPRWQSGVSAVARQSETRFTEKRSFLGRKAESEVEITTAEPPRELTLRVVSGPVKATIRHLLEPAGAGTRLRVEVEAPGVPRLAGGPARRQLKRDFERLRELLES